MPENEQEIIGSQSSVEISVNAKGQYSGKVKAYANTIEEAYENAMTYAAKLAETIEKKND